MAAHSAQRWSSNAACNAALRILLAPPASLPEGCLWADSMRPGIAGGATAWLVDEQVRNFLVIMGRNAAAARMQTSSTGGEYPVTPAKLLDVLRSPHARHGGALRQAAATGSGSHLQPVCDGIHYTALHRPSR